jgi:hypothetical protein
MATVNWIDGNGNWTSGSDWSNGTGPGPTDDAVLANGFYIVSLTSDITVNSITISLGTLGEAPTLQIDNPGGIETIAAGLLNQGEVMVDAVNGEVGGTQVDIGGTLTNTGTISNDGSMSIGSSLTNSGTISIGSGSFLDVNGGANNQGTISVQGDSFGPNGTGDLFIRGAMSGAGAIIVTGGNASVEFGGAVAFTQQITLMPQSGFQTPVTVMLDDPSQFAATLGGMTVGSSNTTPTDAIDLTGIATSDIFSTSLNTSSDVLTVTEIGGATFSIQLSGLYAQGTFVDWVADASGNGSDLFLSSQGQAPNGQFVFAATQPINLALTPDGSNLPPPVNGDFNLEVFTATNGATTAGYQGSALAPGGTLASNGDLVAPSLTLNAGDFAVTDLGNHDSITAGNGNETIVGGSFDTITGGNGTLGVTTGFANTILIGNGETSATVNALAGSDSIALGAGAATVYAAAGDTVNDFGGGSAAVVFSTGESLTIAGSGLGGARMTLTNASGETTVSANSVALVAVAGDTIGGSVAFATINALRGSASVDAGNATVFAANGDTVNSGVVTFGAANLTLSGFVTTFPDYTVQGGAGTLVGGADSVNVTGAGGDTISLSLSADATVNALAGNELVNSGNLATVYGAAGDTINADSSPSATTVVGPSGESLLLTGAAGSPTYAVAGAAGSMSGAAADIFVGLGGAFSDTVTLGAVNGATVAAQFGGEVVNLGSGPDTVFSGQSDTVNAGSGSGTLIALGGEAVTLRGAAASDYTVSGNGMSVGGGASSINAVGVAGDTIAILANAATVNALAGSEVVQLGGGNDTVFGAAGDSIGVAPSTSTISGSQLLLHSDTIPGSAVGFGTFDNLAASSSANVTVGTVSGGNVSGGFNTATDFIFYQNENASETNTIVMTQSSVMVDGIASTELALPDGTTMTLVGVNAATSAMFR